MGAASEQIRVSERVKRTLDRRRQEGESYNDVLERLLAEEGDLLAGFGAFGDSDRGAVIGETHERGERRSRERIEEMANAREES